MSLSKIARNRHGDDVYTLLGGVAHRIVCDHWSVYALQSSYESMLRGEKEHGRLTSYSLLKPSIFQQFGETIVASACFEDTMLYRLWTSRGVEMTPVSDWLAKSLRYQKHENGDRILIAYVTDESWSKTLRDRQVEVRVNEAGVGLPAKKPLPGWLAALSRHALILVTFVLPCFLAVLYYGLIVADRYTSEAQFVVRSPSRAGLDQLTGMIPVTGGERASDEASSVHEFVRSRDAVELLVQKADLRAILSRPEGDVFWRFPGWFSRDLREKLFERYLDFVSIKPDGSTGISTLIVQSFRPEDSVKMAEVLLQGSEALINRLNERARADTIRAATREVETAKARAFERREELTTFRTRAGTVDPAKSSQNLLETIGKLSFEVAQLNAQLAEAQRNSPQGPQITNLRNRIQAVEQQIVEEKRQIGGSAQALAPIIADYERLVLEREFADRALASALASLENARAESQRQQLYLERVVAPHAADYPSQPRRLLWIGIVFLLSLSVYSICRSLRDYLRQREH